MARRELTFICQNCGAAYGRWQGKCDACGEWNTIAEEGGGVAPALARAGHRAVYISGEEAVAQVRLRAERLKLQDAQIELAAETSVEDIIATLSDRDTPRLVVIDSIQTMWTDVVDSAPGTVTQVRGAAQALIRFAKRSGAAVILVGHVTTGGHI